MLVNTLAKTMKEIVPTSLCSFALGNVTSDVWIANPVTSLLFLPLLAALWCLTLVDRSFLEMLTSFGFRAFCSHDSLLNLVPLS